MSKYHREQGAGGSQSGRLEQGQDRRSSPGKVTLASMLPAAAPRTLQTPAKDQAPSTSSGGRPASAGHGGSGALPYRREMEAAFGEDFSAVTVGVGQAESLMGLQARAVTQGEHIDFAETSPSRDTVAHELVHVLQYRRHGDGGTAGMSRPDSPAEREAESIADRVARGEPAPPVQQAARADVPRPDLAGPSPSPSREPVDELTDDMVRATDVEQDPLARSPAPPDPEAQEAAPAPAGATSEPRRAEVAAPADPGRPSDAPAHAASAPPAPVASGPSTARPASQPEPATKAAAGAPPAPGAAPPRRLASAPVSAQQPDKVGEAIARLEGVPPGQLEPALDDLRTQLPALQRQEAEAVRSSLAQPPAPEAPAPRRDPQAAPGAGPQLAAVREQLNTVDQALPPPKREAQRFAPPPETAQRDERRTRRGEAAKRLEIEEQRAHPQQLLVQSHAPTSTGARPRLHGEAAAAPASLERDRRAGDARVAARQQRIDHIVESVDPGMHQLDLPEEPAPPLRIEPPPPPLPPPSQPQPQPRAAASPSGDARASGMPQRGRAQPDAALGTAADGAAERTRARVQAMRAQHEEQRAAHQAQLDTLQVQGDQLLQERSRALQEQQQAVRREAQGQVSAAQADWRARNHASAARHTAEVASLHASASEFITSRTREGEGQAEQHLLAAEQRAAQRKAERTGAARATLDRGRQRAGEILSAVSLPCDNSYEARAIERGGVLMRQEDPWASIPRPPQPQWDDGDIARRVPSYDAGRSQADAEAEARAQAEAEARAQAEAQTEAQGVYDGAVVEAQESLDALLVEIDQLLRDAETLTDAQLATVQAAIEARLSEVRAIQEQLATHLSEENGADAAAAMMQINMNMVQAMGQVLEMRQAHLTATNQDILPQIQGAYQRAIVSHQANSTYYIFVPAARLDSDDITGGRYPERPFSEVGNALLQFDANNDQIPDVGSTQVSYFQANNGQAARDWGDELEGYMGTLAMLDPNANFVLGGHSSSGRAVADAALQHMDGGRQESNPIEELLLFDPHVNYASNGGTPDGISNADADRIAANMEISIFQMEVNGMSIAYDGNQPDVWPYPRSWEGAQSENVRRLPFANTPADLRHYWIVGNMGAEVASLVAGSATNRRPRTAVPNPTTEPPSPTPVGGQAEPTQMPTQTPTQTPTPAGSVPDWPEVQPYSATGYVKDVSSVDGSTNTTLRVRAAPGTNGAPLGDLPESTSTTLSPVTITGQTMLRANASGGNGYQDIIWYQIQFNGRTGYVHSQYIDVH